MRIALVLLVLSLGGCAGAYHTYSDGRQANRIDDSYKARDACLVRNVADDGTMSLDAASVANAAALACSAETDKLIAASDLSGDTKVANQIRQDSEFRALGFVMKARGQAIF